MKKAVLELRPTQFVVGMKEVQAKIERIRGLSGSKLEDYLDEHMVPCVFGPQGYTYMIDHHHFVYAAWQCSLEKVKITVLEEKQNLSHEEFWKFMVAKDWVYLYDQFGKGPHSPSQLPIDVRGLCDDLYRSLAWELRVAGLIPKIAVPFSEFKWAKYLRTHLEVDLHKESYEETVKRAIAMVGAVLSPDNLPKPKK